MYFVNQSHSARKTSFYYIILIKEHNFDINYINLNMFNVIINTDVTIICHVYIKSPIHVIYV